MCGIHGFVNGKGKADVNSDDFLKSGFITNMLRGTDSSGIAVVDVDGFCDVAKVPMPGLYIMQHKAASTLITKSRMRNTASICHVRAATFGSVNYDNAHPFYIEDEAGNGIVGVHNGTLTGWANKKGASAWNVDSAWAMETLLLEKSDAFEQFQGAFAFVWWTTEQPGVLKMARNKERTLFVAYTKDNNMLYASEAGMIHWLAERHRIELKGSIKELEAGMLYAFDITDPTKVEKSFLPVAKPLVSTSTTDTTWNWSGVRGSASKTTVEKLDEIFANVREVDASPQPALVPKLAVVKPAKPPIVGVNEDLVTKDELQDAHQMNMLGDIGVFTVAGADDRLGHLYGEFESDNYSGTTYAVMRDVPEELDWSSNEAYTVRIQGVSDTGNDFILIVSRPVDMKQAQPEVIEV